MIVAVTTPNLSIPQYDTNLISSLVQAGHGAIITLQDLGPQRLGKSLQVTVTTIRGLGTFSKQE